MREKGTSKLPGGTSANRLVARQLDADSVLVRADFDARERLLEDHPETFSVPPSMEAHQKVVVELGRADPDGVRRALAEAVELQRDASLRPPGRRSPTAGRPCCPRP